MRRPWTRGLGLLLLAAGVVPAWGKPIMTSGFESPVTQNTNTADSYEFFEFLIGATATHATGSHNARIVVVGNAPCTNTTTPWGCCGATAEMGMCARNGTNGGHLSSKYSVMVNPASGSTIGGYYMPPRDDDLCQGAQTCGTCSGGTVPGMPCARADQCGAGGSCITTGTGHCECCTGNGVGSCQGLPPGGSFQALSAGIALHVETTPSAGERTFLQMVEDGNRVGCNLRLATTGGVPVVRLYYGYTGITTPVVGPIGTEVKNRTARCTADYSLDCASSADCPSANNTCATCQDSDSGKGCYWGYWVLTQTNQQGGTVCTAEVNGHAAASQTITDAGVKSLRDVAFGATQSENSTATYYLDDFMLDDEHVAPGYDITVAPAVRGGVTWTSSPNTADAAVVTSAIARAVDHTGTQNLFFRVATSDVNTSHQDVGNGSTAEFVKTWPFSGDCTVANDCNLQGGTGQTCTGSPLKCSGATDAKGITKVGVPTGFCAAGASLGQPCLSSVDCAGSACMPEAIAVTGVDIVAFGQASGTATGPTRVVSLAPELCTISTTACTADSTCTPGFCANNLCTTCVYGGGESIVLSPTSNANDHQWGRNFYATAPGGGSWVIGDLPLLGWFFKVVPPWSSPTVKVTLSETYAYIRIDRRLAAPRTLRDHNKGVKACSAHTGCSASGVGCSSATDWTSSTCGWCEGACQTGLIGRACVTNGDCVTPAGASGTCGGKVCTRDGQIIVTTVGDSTNGGTHATTCNGGTKSGLNCSQKDYCSGGVWNTITNFGSSPPAGCAHSDLNCQVCTGRIDQNGQSGIPCVDNNGCPVSGATCNASGNCNNGIGVENTLLPCCLGGRINGTVCVGGPYDTQVLANSCNGLGGTCNLAPATVTCDLGCPGGGCQTSKWCLGGASKHAACTVDANCASSTCVAVECSADVDCRPPLWPAGSYTDTCVGGGVCPQKATAWGQSATDDMTVDGLRECGYDGYRSSMIYQSQSDAILEASDSCWIRQGNGQCSCTNNTDCDPGGTCACLSGASPPCSPAGNGRCTAGAATKISCHTPSDCPGGFACTTPPADYVLVLIGFNDPVQQPWFYAPNCIGRNAVGFAPCDPGYQNLGQPRQLCQSTSECVSAIGPESECYGLARSSASTGETIGWVEVCNRVGGCPDCSNAFGCFSPSASTMVHGPECYNPTATCKCPTVNGVADCTEHRDVVGYSYMFGDPIGRSLLSTCPSGFSLVPYDNATANGFCHLNCTVDADCGAGAGAMAGVCAKYCSAGTNSGKICTVTDGNCTCSSQKVCQGMCTVPSMTSACTTDGDCAGRRIFEMGGQGYAEQSPPQGYGTALLRQFSGHCASGKCRCTGYPGNNTKGTVSPAIENCYAEVKAWRAQMPHDWTARNMHRFEEKIRALTQSVRPLFMLGTIPDTDWHQVGWSTAGHGDTLYYAENSEHIQREFPYTFPARRVFQTRNEFNLRNDWVHFNKTSAALVGHAARDALQVLNVCVQTTNQMLPVKYCMDVNGSFASNTTCPTGVCAVGTTCQNRPCTAPGDCPDASDSCLQEVLLTP